MNPPPSSTKVNAAWRFISEYEKAVILKKKEHDSNW
jgi:hypothetical protein